MAMALNQTALLGDGRSPQRQQIQDANSSKDYILNIDKCLYKKLQATKRQKVEYAVKGGGIVAMLDAVTFEMFRYACNEYFSIPDTQILNVHRDNATDGGGNIVQHTYTVHLHSGKSYTMNLYLTKCSMLINGKATMTFMDEHLPHIHRMMSSTTVLGISVNIKTLNDLLASQLQKIIVDRGLLTLKTPKPPRMNINSDTDNNEDISCVKCNRNCRKRAVQCNSCKRWMHYHCTKIEDSEIQDIETIRSYVFTCVTCKTTHSNKHKLTIPALFPSTVSENTVPKTLSQSILSDEMDSECAVCRTQLRHLPSRRGK